jgi:hypothetical protein
MNGTRRGSSPVPDLVSISWSGKIVSSHSTTRQKSVAYT